MTAEILNYFKLILLDNELWRKTTIIKEKTTKKKSNKNPVPDGYIPRLESKERECWKFLDWRLNSENDSRVHGQPSFAIAVSTQWFMDLSGKNLFSNVKVIWKGRWSIDYHPNPSRLFSFFVFFTFIIFINLFNGMAKETPVEKMKTTVGLWCKWKRK